MSSGDASSGPITNNDLLALAVFITASTEEEANRLADDLVESRLAACVQILPEMKSTYVWQGKVEHQNEILLIAKTTRERFEELERRVRELHSYDTPEIVAVPMTQISEPYLNWLVANVRG